MTNSQALANAVQIKVDGALIDPLVMADLKYVEVQSSMHLPSMALMKFHDPKLTHIDGSLFKLGAQLVILMGHTHADVKEVFNGEIVAHEPVFEETFTATFIIRAYDKLHRLNRETKRRALVQVKDSAVVSQIASEAGLQAQVTATTAQHPVLWQDNLTDLAFVHMLARRNGYEVRIKDGNTLVFAPPATLDSGVIAIWGENLRQFEPRLSLAQQVNEVTVKGYDRKTEQALVGVAASTTNDQQTGISQTGGAAATAAFGAAKHLEPFVGVGLQGYAQKVADSLLKTMNNDYFQAEGWMFGDGRLSAGKQFTIQKVGTRFSGKYRATTVTHVFQLGEYDTYFTIEGTHVNTDGSLSLAHNTQPPLIEQWHGIYPAVVTNINDPDKLMRVKLKYPWLDDTLQSDWAPVILPVGMMSTPLVGSVVAVIFEQGNFNHPYVMGGIYTTKPANKPLRDNTTAVMGAKHIQQIIKTPNGHYIEFQDKTGQEKITITSSDSQMLLLIDITNKKITMQSAMDVLIKATGNMNLEAVGNVTMKGAMVSVEAQTTLDLKSTGVANLKGSMVNIN